MNLLKLGFTDTFGSIENFFIKILSEKYQVIRDDQNPDYLIFGDKNFGNNNVNYNNKNCIKIFYTGENERHYEYQCDYSITFDHPEYEGRNYRLPLYVIYDYDNHHRNVPNTSIINRTPSDLLAKKEFCSFVVKNGGCKKRNEWFQILNSYKGVASGGPLFNNIGYVLPRGEQSVQAKLEFLNSYKFNLCFENAKSAGYHTEKLLHAWSMGAVPLYFGDESVNEEFNSKCFVNLNDFSSLDEFCDYVMQMTDEECARMINEPLLKEAITLESLYSRLRLELSSFSCNSPRSPAK